MHHVLIKSASVAVVSDHHGSRNYASRRTLRSTKHAESQLRHDGGVSPYATLPSLHQFGPLGLKDGHL